MFIQKKNERKKKTMAQGAVPQDLVRWLEGLKPRFKDALEENTKVSLHGMMPTCQCLRDRACVEAVPFACVSVFAHALCILCH